MNCPTCGSARVYPSRLRGIVERARQALTDKQPYRCHQCGWRQWRDVVIHPEGPDARPDDLRTGRGARPVSPKELDQLDPAAPQP
jgi:hypothetical protein